MKNFDIAEHVFAVDAYQTTHFESIPPGMENFQCSQGVYRKPLNPNDHRIVSAGLMPFVKLELETPLIASDIDAAEEYYQTFHAATKPPYHKPYPWPKAMFQKVLDEYGGMLPICVTGLQDGQTHYVGEPCVQVWTDEPGMGELVGWIESTMLPYLWAMSTVATRGRMRKDMFHRIFKMAHPNMSEADREQIIQTRFHDFGRRGGAVSQMTGIAHLMNFTGTDTMDAAVAAQQHLNDGMPFGACSIRAAAHRSITPWPMEQQAYDVHVESGNGGLFAIVADSYEYEKGVDMLCQYADEVKEKDGVLIVRPDSGDPKECVMYALDKLNKAFGSTEMDGLRVLNNCGVIQGDGIDDEDIFDILTETISQGFSPINVAFGMGENNHKASRSEMEMAYKTCMVGTEKTGEYRAVAKQSNSQFKKSIPCPVRANYSNEGCENRVVKATIDALKAGDTEDLVVHYDGRPISKQHMHIGYSFTQTRTLTYDSWEKLDRKPESDTFSHEIRDLQEMVLKGHQ